MFNWCLTGGLCLILLAGCNNTSGTKVDLEETLSVVDYGMVNYLTPSEVEVLSTLAEDGSSTAVAALYNFYMTSGNDTAKALVWLERDASRGMAEPQLMTAIFKLLNHEPETAKFWFLKFENNPTISSVNISVHGHYNDLKHLVK